MCTPAHKVVGKEEEANDHSKGLAKNLFFFSFWVIRLIFGKMGSAWVKVGCLSIHFSIDLSANVLSMYTTNVSTQHIFPSEDFSPCSLTAFYTKQRQHLWPLIHSLISVQL